MFKHNKEANAEIVYGDTDSVFFNFNLKELDGKTEILGKEALKITIEIKNTGMRFFISSNTKCI